MCRRSISECRSARPRSRSPRTIAPPFICLRSPVVEIATSSSGSTPQPAWLRGSTIRRLWPRAGVDLGFAVILGTPPGPKNPITIVGSNGLDTHAVTIDVTTTACVPTTCQGSGFQCGSLSDKCGQTLSCGECAGTGVVCSGGQCVPRRCTAWRRCPRVPIGVRSSARAWPIESA